VPGGCVDPRAINNTCPFKLPKLDAYSQLVLSVFLGMQGQWEAAFGRVGIPYDRLKVKCDALGIELTDHFLEKFDICVGVVLDADGEATRKKE
jgi:hypothetical protein